MRGVQNLSDLHDTGSERLPVQPTRREAVEEMVSMTSKAHVEYDPAHRGIRAAIVREDGPVRSVLVWPPLKVRLIDESNANVESRDEWLQLSEDDARALYEALADHFGHAGHDIRALRKDYDAERARVDRLIEYATQPPVIIGNV